MKFLADLVTFTEEILNGKLHFLSSILNFFHVKYYSENKQHGVVKFFTKNGIQ